MPDGRPTNWRDLEPFLKQFEGREAIYIEQGALRVRVSNIRVEVESKLVTVDVEEIPTPGLGFVGAHNRAFEEKAPRRWDIATTDLAGPTFSSRGWHGGTHSGWSLFFAPEIIAGVVNLAALFPPSLHPAIRYRQILNFVHARVRFQMYVSRVPKAPLARGRSLAGLVRLLENPVTGGLMAPRLARSLYITDLRSAAISDPPTNVPLHGSDADTGAASAFAGDRPPLVRRPMVPFPTIRDYTSAYLSGAVTPEQVAERVMSAIAASDRLRPPLRAFIACNREDVLSQAREATQRYAEGRPLGPLDGVPIAVKDEIDMVPYPTTVGTRFLGETAATMDSTVVSRLRSAGSLLIGKTNMHEIGILPFGVNPHFGAVRNPYNPARDSGGSSSGSAAAVASGLCPAAIGADGGGSIRIPAAFCGVVGLKPTYGRVSEFGAAPLCWSVAHVGPIGATVEDVARVYAVIAGRDSADPHTLGQPPLRIEDFDGTLRGVRIGIYRDWFCDADSEVVAVCDRAVQLLAGLGAEVVEVTIPDLHLTGIAFGVTILAEMAASMTYYDRAHRRDFGLTTQLMLAMIRTVRPDDYVQAQRFRTQAIRSFLSALKAVDAIVTPATAITAPEIPENALPEGESNVELATRAMRFTSPANFTGLPAITVPAGYDHDGLPVGLQLIGRPWDEGRLFGLGCCVEGIVELRKPAIYYNLLPEWGACQTE